MRSFISPDHRIFQRLHRPFRETGSFQVTRHDTGTLLRRPSLEKSILNVVTDKPESSTGAVAYHLSVSSDRLQSVKRKSLTPLPFSASTKFESSRLSSPTASG
ncbi:hypothetical protein TNCV_1869221 [Trichonephila clavipes]|nr:hypothetical protein TNCV_1869221 [Trichonephila clavipes]